MATEIATKVKADIVYPPGEFLAEELEARKMTQSALASAMGRPIQTINSIIRGKKAITAETALQLEQVLDIEAEFWMNLEARYRLALARQSRKQ